MDRRGIIRDGIAVGLATGAYGVSFGAISIAAGLSIAQTCALSLLMFTGASQFAFVGIIGGGGSALAGAGTAVLLGSRNALYGLRLSVLLDERGARRLVASQLVIDESTGLALREPTAEASRVGFWAAGLSVFAFWNLGTLAGAIAGEVLPDPKALGLDAAVPAAFVALLAPRMRGREPWAVALIAAAVAVVAVPYVPTGVPVLLAAAVAVVAGMRK